MIYLRFGARKGVVFMLQRYIYDKAKMFLDGRQGQYALNDNTRMNINEPH